MTTQTCPDRATLERFLLGKLTESEQSAISEHLQNCHACTAAADTLSPQDEITRAIRSRKALTGDEVAVAVAAEKGKLLSSQLQTLQPDETVIGDKPQIPPSDLDVTVTHGSVKTSDEALNFLAPAQGPDELGRLGDYRILELLGMGGMGMVFRAEDARLKRQVALKVMKPSVAASRTAKDRFLREAQFTAAIEHDNIVQIFQVGEDNNVPFIAMPFLKGESLKTRQERVGRMSQKDVLKVGIQVAAGLAAAHERNLIHRDIKPDNIWIEEKTGRAKILDFGLVRATSDDAGLTQSGMVMGTPRYMAPEQALGQDVDHRCDLFSLGSVLYHLASGKLPFEGSNVTATLMAVVQKDPKPLDAVISGLDPALCDMIARMMRKNRDDRPKTAIEVAKGLTAILQKLKQSDPADPNAVRRGSPDPAPARRGSPDPAETADRRSPELPANPLHVAEDAGDLRSATSAGSGDLRTTQDPRTTEGDAVRRGSPDPAAPRTTQTSQPPGKPPRRKILAAAGAGGILLALLGIIVITIRDKDGKETVIRVPEGTEIDVKAEPGSKVTIRQEGMSPDASSVSNATSQISNPATGWHGWPADAPAPAIAPFHAAQAKKHQEEWAAYLKIPVEYTNSIGMKFRLIPPGEFLMGATAAEVDDMLGALANKDDPWKDIAQSAAPQHRAVLTKPFYMGVHEVTQAEFTAVMHFNPSFFSQSETRPHYFQSNAEADEQFRARLGEFTAKAEGTDTSTHPVEGMLWSDAADFFSKLSIQEKMNAMYFVSPTGVTDIEGTGYRFPTEAEWEFACRAGSTTRFWFGDAHRDLTRVEWVSDNSGERTHVVGELKANSFGLFDMLGNVKEYVSDEWSADYFTRFTDTQAVDPRGPLAGDISRIARGGDWHYSPTFCMSCTRNAGHIQSFSSVQGFRAALPIDAVRNVLQVNGPALQ